MDNITVLVLANPVEPRLAMLEELPDSTTIAVGEGPEAFERAAPDASVILNWSGHRPEFEQVWRMAPRVRWVHSRSAGLDHVLVPELVDSPAVLTNGRGVFSPALAEFAMGAVFYFARGFRQLIRDQTAGIWERRESGDVRGKTLGIIGYGSVGQAVAQSGHALGMRVLALRKHAPSNGSDPYAEQVLGMEGKQELLARSDYVVLTTPLTPETRGLIGAVEIGALKPDAVLINIARGPVVNEAALLHALESGGIRGAALDVFDIEPLPAGHAFYSLENVLLSPHCADNTAGWSTRAMRVFVDNFERFRQGEPLLNVVNKKLGY